MAKDKERQIAQTLYIDQCLTAKEISQKLHVTEKTVGDWVRNGNWKEIQLSKQTTPDVLIGKYNELLTLLLDKRLVLEKNKGKDNDTKMRSVIDEMSKVSAMIERLHVEGKASLRTHINVIEKFMGALHNNNPKLFMQLIDFQKEYLTILTEELR